MKIKTREEISKISEDLKKKGKVIVSCNGSFDLLHIGHVKFLQEAKKQGDVLIVGLNSDSSIKSYKSSDRPIIGEKYRGEMVSAFECVDYVTIYDEKDSLAFVESVKPNVHVNGAEYGMDCIEAHLVKKYGGKIHLVPKFEGFSTTELISKIKKT